MTYGAYEFNFGALTATETTKFFGRKEHRMSGDKKDAEACE